MKSTGEFGIYSNQRLLGPVFIKDLDKSLEGIGKVSDYQAGYPS